MIIRQHVTEFYLPQFKLRLPHRQILVIDKPIFSRQTWRSLLTAQTKSATLTALREIRKCLSHTLYYMDAVRQHAYEYFPAISRTDFPTDFENIQTDINTLIARTEAVNISRVSFSVPLSTEKKVQNFNSYSLPVYKTGKI